MRSLPDFTFFPNENEKPHVSEGRRNQTLSRYVQRVASMTGMSNDIVLAPTGDVSLRINNYCLNQTFILKEADSYRITLTGTPVDGLQIHIIADNSIESVAFGDQELTLSTSGILHKADFIFLLINGELTLYPL